MSIGRLGLFKYYDMDDVVAWCIRNCDALESFAGQTEARRGSSTEKHEHGAILS